MSARVTVVCDAPGCRNRRATGRRAVIDARDELAAAGWETSVHGWRCDPQRDGRGRYDFCPEHREMVRAWERER